MSLFEKQITVDDIVIVLQRENPNKSAFYAAILEIQLFKLFPEVRDLALAMGAANADTETKASVANEMKNKDPFSLALAGGPINQIFCFISFNNHLKRIEGFPWDTSSLDNVQATFNWFLEHPTIWSTAEPVIAQLDKPNGEEGTPSVLVKPSDPLNLTIGIDDEKSG